MHFDRRSAPVRKERTAMKYAFDNANLIDGTQDMRVQPGQCVLTDGETITDIVPAGTAPAGYKRIDLLKDYIARTQQRVEEYNRQHDIPSGEDKINGLHQTNIGVFRNYLNLYLRQNERVNQNMMVLVRQLQPTEQGLPMELYFFTDTVDWVPYEGIQADVFDHVLAVIPEFDLRVFQNPSGNDLRTLTGKTDTNH